MVSNISKIGIDDFKNSDMYYLSYLKHQQKI
nr:MAG TPA_asm: hypothetical protein [Caudoviricetes sp.]